MRGDLLSRRREEFVVAAIGFNAPILAMVRRHLVPNVLNRVLVSLTLCVPAMIQGETALSFLGIGLQAPVVSLGMLIRQAHNVQDITLYPWLLIPGAFVVLIVLTPRPHRRQPARRRRPLNLLLALVLMILATRMLGRNMSRLVSEGFIGQPFSFAMGLDVAQHLVIPTIGGFCRR